MLPPTTIGDFDNDFGHFLAIDYRSDVAACFRPSALTVELQQTR